ncbi:TetR/AcrR family transcriptional regulator [Proteiniphilum sp. X52]|uniref:TetR/AcrR family transcriptional regulator n=1 Tax=Proteiniphilum sp. X52 TaxID=2382159 RepID=UPI000F0A8E7D|nr:TetR/AcrR family transcriptional regulator [Proteiniphilum sp. X52]RNC67003.1 TetR/AcrR family transcriptional regulator [Proteiniphilum sp. X52]
MRQKDEQKELLLKQKAIEMVVAEGLEGFGINKLAKAAKISPGTIYIYYKNKDDFMYKLSMELGFRILDSSLENFNPNMHFDEGLRLQWKNRYNYYKKFPLEVQFVEKVRYSPIYNTITNSLNDQYGNLLGNWINLSIKRKELFFVSFEIYWSLAFAPLYQLLKFDEQKESSKAFVLNQEVINTALNQVLKGLKP